MEPSQSSEPKTLLTSMTEAKALTAQVCVRMERHRCSYLFMEETVARQFSVLFSENPPNLEKRDHCSYILGVRGESLKE